MNDLNPVQFRLRECWLHESNRRQSIARPGVPGFTVHAIVVERLWVEEAQRRQGHCKRFIERLCAEHPDKLIVIEAVQDPILAEALLRWGWECDSGVMDFYWRVRASAEGKRTTA